MNLGLRRDQCLNERYILEIGLIQHLGIEGIPCGEIYLRKDTPDVLSQLVICAIDQSHGWEKYLTSYLFSFLWIFFKESFHDKGELLEQLLIISDIDS